MSEPIEARRAQKKRKKKAAQTYNGKMRRKEKKTNLTRENNVNLLARSSLRLAENPTQTLALITDYLDKKRPREA